MSGHKHRAKVWRWGALEAPAIVALHSLGLDGGSFRWLAAELTARSKVQVIAPDLPGHGTSDALAPDITLEAMAQEVVRILDDLGIDRAHLLGSSMGATVARMAVALEPSRWNSVTLLAGGPAAVPALAQRGEPALAAGMQSVVDATLRRWFPEDAVAADDEFVRYARGCLLAMDPRSWAASWRALSAYGPLGHLPQGLPAFCVAGELDASATPQVVAALREAAGVRAPLQVIPAGHHQLYLSKARELAELLRAQWVAKESST